MNFLKDTRGGFALTLALILPVAIGTAGAAIEYSSLASRHSQLQRGADSAALAGAQQLRLSNVTDTVVTSVAEQVMSNSLPVQPDTPRTFSASVINRKSGIVVSVTEQVPSVMGQLINVFNSRLEVTATAQISGNAKLCLLTLEDKAGKALFLEASSSISAPGCGIFSNSRDASGLRADPGARATAAVICSTGGVQNQGAFLSPAPTTDCKAANDPLATRQRPSTGFCTGLEQTTVISSSTRLFPGTYCKGLKIQGSAQVTLSAGIYVINDGPLIVTNTASISGQNVGFFFTGDNGGLRFDPDTAINLTAPKDGVLAGLLFFEDRSVSAPALLPIGPTGIAPPPPPPNSGPMRQYRITSNNAPNLLGTIYLPAGRLIIDSTRAVADRSAFTVVVVKQLDLNSGPNLYLNSNYDATDIPVPDGVGPKSGTIVLTK